MVDISMGCNMNEDMCRMVVQMIHHTFGQDDDNEKWNLALIPDSADYSNDRGDNRDEYLQELPSTSLRRAGYYKNLSKNILVCEYGCYLPESSIAWESHYLTLH